MAGRKPGSKNKATRVRQDGLKECTKCKTLKPFSEFHKHKQCIAGYNTVCKLCRIPVSKTNYSKTSKEAKLFSGAKWRASRSGREFTIVVEDIHIPQVCPIFNIPFTTIGEYSPSLDRVDSCKGYTPTNIQVVCKRANTLKNNATKEELKMILEYLEGGCEAV